MTLTGNHDKKIAIIGGGGQIGFATTQLFHSLDWKVSVVVRDGSTPAWSSQCGDVELIRGDINCPETIGKVASKKFDVVVDAICFDEADADRLIRMARHSGLIVAISSASVYCDSKGRTLEKATEEGYPEFDGPIDEQQETVGPGNLTYSTKKVSMERRLLGQNDIPVSILRPGAIHGLFSRHPREWWFVKRVLDRRRVVPLAYAGTSRFQTTAADNIAKAIEAVAAVPGSRILNVCDPECFDVMKIGQLISEALDYNWEIMPLAGPPDRRMVGATPWSIPNPIELDMAAAHAIGYMPATGYASALAPLCQWLRHCSSATWEKEFPILASYPWNLFDYEAEDMVIFSQ